MSAIGTCGPGGGFLYGCSGTQVASPSSLYVNSENFVIFERYDHFTHTTSPLWSASIADAICLSFVASRAEYRDAHAIFEFPMVDRDPLPRWSHGRVTLLGDAAHPMYPIGSNGASQSIIDGEAIAQELSAGDDPEKALRRYEERRLPPMARIVESNRRKGIDVMLDLVEERAPQGYTDLESVLPAAELERIVGDYKKLAAQDRETLLKLAGRP